jgi:DUF1009 family protein
VGKPPTGDYITIKLGEIGKLFRAMKSNNVEVIVFAGFVKRPSFKYISLDWEAAKIITRLAIKKMTDDNIFKTIINEIESRGFKVIGAEKVMPEIMFSEGIYTKTKPTAEDMEDIQRGINVSKALGLVDVGQACVVQQNMVLAVEAMEGTDEMMARANSIRRPGKPPVMIKIRKPKQDMRVDVPTIGLQTIEQLKKCGISGIAVEAGAIILIQHEEVIKYADESGIFIIGMRVD